MGRVTSTDEPDVLIKLVILFNSMSVRHIKMHA